MFSLVSESIDAQTLRQSLEDDRAGAFVAFEGRVRNHNEGRQVLSLEYEAFDELAVCEGLSVVYEAQQRFGILKCCAVHRTGALAIGDIAVWVGVLTAHRAEAFEACRYIIDEIKHRLPIWKKEHYFDGTTQWVNCGGCAVPSGAEEKAGSIDCGENPAGGYFAPPAVKERS